MSQRKRTDIRVEMLRRRVQLIGRNLGAAIVASDRKSLSRQLRVAQARLKQLEGKATP